MNDTELCNIALGRIGQARIMDLDENTAPARNCARFYASTRDEVLRSFPWNFARSRAVLTALSDAPTFGYDYQYQLPDDCLRVLTLNGEELQVGGAMDRYVIEGRRLLTNADVAKITYVRREEDANQFDPLFVEAFALKLASKLSTLVTGSREQEQTFLQEYARLTAPLARSTDGREGKPRKRLSYLDSDSVASRGGGLILGSASSAGASSPSSSSASDVYYPGGPASGDLSDNFPDPTVAGIQGIPVSETAPTNGQTLIYNATTGQYEPGTGSGSGTVTSVALSGGTTGLSASGGPITGSGTFTLSGTLVAANGGTGATTASGARTALGLAIGTDVQAHSAVLDATTASFTSADESKLDGIEANATAGATWGSDIDSQPSLVSQGEAEAGVSTTERMWSALRVAQAIAALAAGGGVQNNYAATSAPTTGDDSDDGYAVGSVWIDTTADEAYRCVDPTVGSAVWIETTLETSELAAIALSGAYADLASIPAAIDAIDGLTPAADRLAYYTGASSAALATLTSFARNLLDDGDAGTARTTLGVDAAGTDNAPAASDSVAGKVELATPAEAVTGTDTARAVTPEGLMLARRSVTGINTQSGTSYTLAASDAGGYVRCNNAATFTLTVPTNASVTIPVNSVMTIRQVGAGQVQLSHAGVTVNLRTGKVANSFGQGGVLQLVKVATDEWDLFGDLEDA